MKNIMKWLKDNCRSYCEMAVEAMVAAYNNTLQSR